MKTPEMLDYVRDIGALGGTLTLEYDSGELTLTGEELIQAAADYEMSEPFSIVPEPGVPWELANEVTEEEYAPGTFAKLVVAGVLLSAFALVVVLTF